MKITFSLPRIHHRETATITRKGTARWRRITLIVFAAMLAIFSFSDTIRAFAYDCPNGMSTLDCQALWGGWADWVPDNTCATTATSNSSSGAITVPAGQNSGTWSSGLSAPYFIEEFMIETLKDIAHKEGVPETNAVTQQHVIGLMALAWGEGGGLTNNDFWNPFNTGINAPDLTAGGVHVTNGVQAFKSFDAGVEGTARAMTGSTQGRLGATLVNPSSTASDFLTSWLDFPPKPPYPTGHYPWAEASDPNSQYFQADYKDIRVKLISQATTNYTSMASTIMRGQASDPADKHVDASKLHFQANGGTTGTDTSASSAQSCACGPTTSSNVIVIDPGHNADDSYVKNGNKDVIDPATGLKDYDYPNHPELEEVFDVATKVQAKLTQDGYKVIMTKQSADSNANPTSSVGSFRTRADIANNAHAALAISIHDQSGANGGLPFASANNYVYTQQLGLHRDLDNGTQIKFGTAPAAGSQAVADTSAKYGQIFADARTAAEGHQVTVTTADINRGPRFSPGNIWMVQLFSNVPWIYNEVGGNSAGQNGLSEADKTKYANGLIAGVEKAVPLNIASASGSPAGCGSGAFFDTAKTYAWPTYHDAPYCKMKPEYAKAVQAALDRIHAGKNDYVGGGSNTISTGDSCNTGHAGIDCGGFVTRVFRDSKADPNYNANTGNVVSQFFYVSSHPNLYQKVTDTSKLHPGDIFFASDLGHTYIYVGANGYPGYDSVSASFSTTGESWRTPMASKAYDISSATWYRPLFSLGGVTSTATGN